MAIRWKLRACRVQAGYTQKEAAELLGISESTLIKYETGVSAVNMECGQRMSDIYQIPIELMDFTKIGNTVIKN